MVDIISIASGVVSIILACYAIWYAKEESKKSEENYNKTKELLVAIEHKADLIDRSVQLQQTQLITIINKALDKVGYDKIDVQPIPLEEIAKLVSETKEYTDQKVDDVKKELSNKISYDDEIILDGGTANI